MLTVSDPSLLPLDDFLCRSITSTLGGLGELTEVRPPLFVLTSRMRTSSESAPLEFDADDDVTRLLPAMVRISSPSRASPSSM